MELLYNGIIINESRSYNGYILIDNDRIAEVGKGSPDESLRKRATVLTDVNGDYIIPGVIDDQVHFRDPGLTYKGDIATESRAAVAGGVTSFMDMPNTKPQTVTLEALEAKYERAAQVSQANYSFYIGATNDNIEVVKSVDFARVCGVKAFLGSSTGNMLLDNPDTLRRLFSEVDALIAIHSEDENIIRANREHFTQLYGEDLPLKFHKLIRNEQACYSCTKRATDLARQCGTRLHVLHVSTASELNLFDRLPLEEKKITAEVCVNYLLFSDEDYSRLGNRIKCNPAIKSATDREALRNGLREGLLDVVATDHAPHLLSEKEGGCLKAASGSPLAQFSLIAMLEMANQAVFTNEQVIDKMCHAPAILYRIEDRGFLRRGYYADIAVVHRVNDGYTLTDADVISRCGWTPLNGMTMHHKVVRTYVNGKVAYNDGQVNESTRGCRLTFKH
jgi:dihydroorotase